MMKRMIVAAALVSGLLSSGIALAQSAGGAAGSGAASTPGAGGGAAGTDAMGGSGARGGAGVNGPAGLNGNMVPAPDQHGPNANTGATSTNKSGAGGGG